MTTIRYQLTAPEVTSIFLRHHGPRRFLFWWRVSPALLGLGVVAFGRWVADQDLAGFLVLAGGLLFLLAAGLLLAAPWGFFRNQLETTGDGPGVTSSQEDESRETHAEISTAKIVRAAQIIMASSAMPTALPKSSWQTADF